MQYTKLRFYMFSALFAALIATMMYLLLLLFPDIAMAT